MCISPCAFMYICWVSVHLFTCPSGPKTHTTQLVVGLHRPVPYTPEHRHKHAYMPSSLSAYSSCPSPIALIATSCKEKPDSCEGRDQTRMYVGVQQSTALLLLGLILGAAAKLNCVGSTYPNGHRCCHECQPGEWPGLGMWGRGISRE